jgi:hypothetical protein
MRFAVTTVLSVLVLTHPVFAAEAEENYKLTCNRELRPNLTSKATSAPFSVEIAYTGKVISRPDPKDGEMMSFDELLLKMGGEAKAGGRVFGSTYDASRTWDGEYEWAYSRGLNGFSVTRRGKSYLCKVG